MQSLQAEASKQNVKICDCHILLKGREATLLDPIGAIAHKYKLFSYRDEQFLKDG